MVTNEKKDFSKILTAERPVDVQQLKEDNFERFLDEQRKYLEEEREGLAYSKNLIRKTIKIF